MTALDRERWRQLRALLADLEELPPVDREARLATLPPELAAEARALLAAAADGRASREIAAAVGAGAAAVLAGLGSQRAGAEPPAGGATPARYAAPADSPTASHGQQIGAWRLVRPLGSGGMGQVWEVEHADPELRQRAALKLLKRGLDSEQILARFRRERQILARLRHPAIAHLYDGGMAPDGRPFFVMELVPDGEPITTGAARRGLSLDERLRAFLIVCDAVEVAHRSLVVHRDLKPTNVLLTPTGEVKLLDFGIAKLLSEAADDDGVTLESERVMTPGYAAPEQVLGEPVTTATDVYALGVVLYELLTGRRPYRRGLASAAKLVEVVTRETVERPSTAVLEPGDDPAAEEPIPTVERQQRARRLRGDLDWIVLKALAREPERRYAGAAALAADIRRHMTDLPVEARPDSLHYRLGRFVRRHRVGVAAAALVALSLVGGLGAAFWQARRATAAGRQALAEAARARREAKRAEKIADFLKGMILEANPTARGTAEPLTLLEVVRQGATRVEDQLGGEPGLQAQMMIFFGDLALTLEDIEGAARLVERAHAVATGTPGVDAITVADSEGSLGQLRFHQRRLPEAERAFRSSLTRLDRVLAANPTNQRALELRATVASLFGQTLWLQDRIPEAIEQVQRALAIHTWLRSEESPDVAIDVTNLGRMQTSAGRLTDAERSYRRSLALHRKLFGPGDARIHYVASGLGDIVFQLGPLDEAYRLYEEALAAAQKGFGPTHSTVGLDLLDLARVRSEQGRYAEAQARIAESIRVAEASSSRDLMARIRTAEGEMLVRQGRPDEAAARYRQARGLLAARGREGSTQDLMLQVELERLRATGGQPAAAAAALAELVGKVRAQAPSAAEVVTAMQAQGEALAAAGRGEGAVAALREAAALGERALGPGRRETARADLALGLVLVKTEATVEEGRRRLTSALARLEALGRGTLPEVARGRAASSGGD